MLQRPVCKDAMCVVIGFDLSIKSCIFCLLLLFFWYVYKVMYISVVIGFDMFKNVYISSPLHYSYGMGLFT